MRRLVAITAGALLALALFFGLALLVAPPEALREPAHKLTFAMTEAPAQQAEQPTAQPAEATLPEPAAAPMRPAAAPQPVPDIQSAVALPLSEAPPPEQPDISLDSTLPELDVAKPQPVPKPKPQPTPRPQPRPEPTPQTTPQASSSARQQSAQSSAASGGAQSAQDIVSAQQKGLIQPVKMEKPDYPRRARRRGTEGFVEIQFEIQTNGRVDRNSITIVDSRPGNIFNDAAREAVSGWVFERLDNPVHIIQRLEFKLRGG
ncbi:energy transducer TonB [Phytohalomonas tamaricis]|uniref:energy transducer TonB n=1 Tax=Phytohalomonas tamaricis TaxID=2081032 RepID=UPI000D0ADFA3|nr:energy transducer TonB [Phytohalomonas tamaricis]